MIQLLKKKLALGFIFILITFSSLNAQEWMTSLDMAKRLALSQDKMVLMVWEESVFFPYRGIIKNEKGEAIHLIKNVFDDETFSKIVWEYFVPVIVSDHLYGELFEEIKGKRTQKYIDKFDDDEFKVMDINGNIINTSPVMNEILDITKFITNYGLNTSFVEQELRNYRKQKDFYSAFYLADKYNDFATYVNGDITSEIIELSEIYLNEAKSFLETSDLENEVVLKQRCELIELKQSLILARPRKVIRGLEKMEKDSEIEKTNQNLKAFLYYTAYLMVNDKENMAKWKSEVSLVDLKKVQAIINSTIRQRQ